MGLNYDFREKSENLRSLNHFEKLNKADIKDFFSKIAKFFKYYVYILALNP